ncbi:MAG: TonB-dependent receptor, partial [Thermoflexibacter sp.]|nr:TonB-dependent receptor [Thermoflexibacter sp.]
DQFFKPQIVDQVSLGVYKNFRGNIFETSVEVYYKDIQNVIEYKDGATLLLQNNLETEIIPGQGKAYGAEFYVKKNLGRTTGWASYTLSEVIYNFPQISEQSFYALQDQTHEFKMVGSYNIGRWTLSGTWVYATGKPYTAPIGGYELTLLDGSKQSYVSVGDKNSFRLPNYHRMDLAFTYHFKIDKAKAEAGITFFNVYNRTNVRYKEFEVIDNQIYETNVNLLGFTPNFFFNFKLR